MGIHQDVAAPAQKPSEARRIELPDEIRAVRGIRELIAAELHRMVGLLDRLDLLLDGDADLEEDDVPEDDDPDHGIEDVGHDEDDNGLGDVLGAWEQGLDSDGITNSRLLYEGFLTERWGARVTAGEMVRKARKLRRTRQVSTSKAKS